MDNAESMIAIQKELGRHMESLPVVSVTHNVEGEPWVRDLTEEQVLAFQSLMDEQHAKMLVLLVAKLDKEMNVRFINLNCFFISSS